MTGEGVPAEVSKKKSLQITPLTGKLISPNTFTRAPKPEMFNVRSRDGTLLVPLKTTFINKFTSSWGVVTETPIIILTKSPPRYFLNLFLR